ncbi:MAG TPA: RagB/SusD family nutrient uptake outer membrane protein [Arachidicoccus sp.]|nr:RagB/SusD family nutrient uptake outer membrane protein [Arachidicoccus sp.]
MKKILLYTVVAVLIFSTNTGCNKWLNVEPENGIIRDNYWKTKEQLEAAVVGCYSSLLDNDLVVDMFAWGEMRADMVTSTLKSSNDLVNIMQANILSSNPYTDWSPFYRTINYCNTVLDFGPGVLSRDATLTEEQQNAYLAEAHGLRALMYFYLLRTFGEVPLQLEATSSDEQVKQLVKSSKEEVFNQIIKDLEFAEKYAVETYGDLNKDKGRLTKYSVYAIAADVYLWEDKYADCIAACDKVINSQRFGLVDGSDQSRWFNNLYFKGNSSESIFEFQFDQQALNPFYDLFISTNQQFIAAPSVMEEVYGLDPTGLTFDIRGNGGSLNAADGMIWKFAGASSGTTLVPRTADQSYAHWFVYRFADILLMKAEALNQTGKGQEALDLVATIRARAHATENTFQQPDPSDKGDIAAYILAERSREFAFEGKRWFDLLRYAKRDNYANLNTLLLAVTANSPGYLQQTIINKYKDVRSHYLPINAQELQTDKALVQNPYYK